MNKILSITGILLFSLFFSGCSGDDDSPQINASEKLIKNIKIGDDDTLLYFSYNTDKTIKAIGNQAFFSYDNGRISTIEIIEGGGISVYTFSYNAEGKISSFEYEDIDEQGEPVIVNVPVTYIAQNNRYTWTDNDNDFEMDLYENDDLKSVKINNESEIYLLYEDGEYNGTLTNTNQIIAHFSMTSSSAYIFSIFNISKKPVKLASTRDGNFNYGNSYDNQGFIIESTINSNIESSFVLGYEY